MSARARRRYRAAHHPAITDLVEAWDRHCAYCGVPVAADPVRRAPDQPTVDHFVPKRAGGRNVANLVLACSRCNNLKGSIDPRRLLMIWLKVDRPGFYRAVRAILRHERQASRRRTSGAG